MVIEVQARLEGMRSLSPAALRDEVVRLASERDFQGALDVLDLIPGESRGMLDREWQAYCLAHAGEHEMVRSSSGLHLSYIR